MARPQKEGLEYFPLDVDIDQDDKLVVPIAKHGMLGFGVIVKLMMEVYKNGYYYPWTEKERYVFPFKNGVDPEKVQEIVIDCINSGFFCKNQYKRNQILTSYGFQKRFLMAVTRRKGATINERYLVQKELLPTETELLPTETPELSVESTQKKLKETKQQHIADSDECGGMFGEFWDIYPKKQGKAAAEKKWRSYYKQGLISPLNIEFILENTENYIAYVKHERNRGFDRQFMDGSTFVNQQRWNDDWTIKEQKDPYQKELSRVIELQQRMAN